MKILTIIGTRPELIRLSLIIKKLDKIKTIDHILVYTNQNYDYNLSTIFFDELEIRQPDYYFNIIAKSFGDFFGNSIIEFEKILIKEKPDKILLLGDTNSGLLSIVAEKYKIPIYHMEAGNRAYDKRLPEETNRKIIDSISTINLPYTEDSKNILIEEGYNRNNIVKTGNPIFEVIENNINNIMNSKILEKLKLINKEDFILVTIHRSENVDNPVILNNIISAINLIAEDYIVVFSVHPRTRDKLLKLNIKLHEKIIDLIPVGFYDFIFLEKNAKIIITDSGTVQEEASILNIPVIVVRETTERREIIENGASIITGTNTENIINSFKYLIKEDIIKSYQPFDYIIKNVSDIVIKVLIGKNYGI